MFYKIKPDKECKVCGGSGVVVENHPYGSTTAPETFWCNCVLEQIENFSEMVDGIELIESQPAKNPRSCEFCRFFQESNGDNIGQCRRYAPRPGYSNIDHYPHWPTVFTSNWCGEWKGKSSGKYVE